MSHEKHMFSFIANFILPIRGCDFVVTLYFNPLFKPMQPFQIRLIKLFVN